MGVDLIIRVALIGILVSILNAVLSKLEHKELTVITSVLGVIIVLMMVMQHIFDFFDTVRTMFQF